MPSLHSDANGGILYVCDLVLEAAPSATEPPPVGAAAVPISPFPASLVFHSRPGAANVLYLNFTGETVINTEWNNVVARSVIPAAAFSTDSDYSTFSDAEQLAIKRIWQRVAEDYAPFQIDVTTERPATFTTRTAHALITRTTDANGAANPYSTAGGVGYVNVFGTTSYAQYRPAWIYFDNLGYEESYIAEAAAHEIGHNLGLSHDGKTDGSEYYGGHGSGDISWGPLMGTGYTSRYILDHPEVVRGKRVLDFGSGSGLIAIAAMKAGARSVLAADIDSFAAAAIVLNAEVNDVSVVVTDENLVGAPNGGWDVILIGDMCYERPLAESIEIWIHGLVVEGAVAFIGDPGRTYLPKTGLEKIISYAVKTTRELEDTDVRNTSVWRVLIQ